MRNTKFNRFHRRNSRRIRAAGTIHLAGDTVLYREEFDIDAGYNEDYTEIYKLNLQEKKFDLICRSPPSSRIIGNNIYTSVNTDKDTLKIKDCNTVDNGRYRIDRNVTFDNLDSVRSCWTGEIPTGGNLKILKYEISTPAKNISLRLYGDGPEWLQTEVCQCLSYI